MTARPIHIPVLKDIRDPNIIIGHIAVDSNIVRHNNIVAIVDHHYALFTQDHAIRKGDLVVIDLDEQPNKGDLFISTRRKQTVIRQLGQGATVALDFRAATLENIKENGWMIRGTILQSIRMFKYPFKSRPQKSDPSK
ncbi:hypothetical protein ACFLVR_01990 [Chloroflexota bacterium]